MNASLQGLPQQFRRHIGMNHAEPEESDIVTAKGQRVTVEISASTVTLPDGRQVIVGNFRDITERKKAEEKRLSDIGRLAATVAHELRNPLGVIKVAAYNIRRKKKGTTLDGHLDVIDKKISESDQIIQNLLFYARTKTPHFERVAVVDILNISLGHCRDRYAGWDIEVKNLLDLEEKYFIEADALQLSELFANILDNAYHAFSDKKGAIEIALGYGGNDRLYITVSDNGCGIGKDELPKVFEPFFTNRAKGVGLGLTICKQVAELHGGTIDLKSEAGKGTTVTVTLPVTRGPQ